jgi:hypothetical protein
VDHVQLGTVACGDGRRPLEGVPRPVGEVHGGDHGAEGSGPGLADDEDVDPGAADAAGGDGADASVGGLRPVGAEDEQVRPCSRALRRMPSTRSSTTTRASRRSAPGIDVAKSRHAARASAASPARTFR